jgi:hypothetical protein
MSWAKREEDLMTKMMKNADRGLVELSQDELNAVAGAPIGLIVRAAKAAYDACRASTKCKVAVLGGAGVGAAGAGYENNRE